MLLSNKITYIPFIFIPFFFFFFILGRSTLQPLLRGPKLFILGHDDA